MSAADEGPADDGAVGEARLVSRVMTALQTSTLHCAMVSVKTTAGDRST